MMCSEYKQKIRGGGGRHKFFAVKRCLVGLPQNAQYYGMF